MADSNVNIQVDANTGSAVGALSQLNQSLTHVGATVNTVSSRLYRMGHTIQEVGQNMYSIGQNATVGISLPLAALGKKLIETGSSMKAMHQTFKVVFGDMTDEAQAWSKELSKSVGLSSGIIDKTNLGFAKMAGAFGLTGQEALDFSTKWTKMTLDLAAFNDVSIEDAADRMKSGLRGEADAVETLGIFMGETQLKAQMLTMGIKGQYSALDSATKANVLYALATKQTAQAQGQATREAVSYQNSLANLKQTFNDFAEKFYIVVEPAVLDFMGKLNELAKKLDGMSDEQIIFWSKVALGLIVIPPLIMYLGATIEAFGRLFKLFAFAGKGFGLMITGFKWFGKELLLLPTRIGVWAIQIQSFLVTIGSAVMGFMTTVATAIGISVGWLIAIIVGIAVAVFLVVKYWDEIKAFTVKAWEGISAWLANEWEYIKKVASSAWNSITGFFAGIWAGITGVFENKVTPVVDKAKGVFNSVSGVVVGFGKSVMSVMSAVGWFISYVWKDLILPLLQYVGGFFVAVGELIVWAIEQLIIMAIDWLAEKWQWLYSNVIAPVGTAISDTFTSIGQFFSDMYNNYIVATINAFKAKWAELSGAVTTGYEEEVVPVVDGMKSGITSVKDWWATTVDAIKAKWTAFVTALKSAWNSVATPVMETVKSVINDVKATWDSVWDGAKSKFDNFVEGIKSAWSGVKSAFKLPHISISGSWDLTPPNISAPKLGVDWYKKGGLFNGASVIGVGEAGSEAVLPLTNSRTMSMLGAKVAEYMPDLEKNGNSAGNGVVINMNGNVVIREEADIEKIGQALYKEQQRESRRLGRSGR
ncbi:hypothetical protein JCM17380_24890 [Desulfosporosinus burensis]